MSASTCNWSDLRDRDYLDMVDPAYPRIGRDRWAEFAFGCITAGGELDCSQTIVFHWRGASRRRLGLRGRKLQHDGSVEIELSFDNGDEAILTGRRE